MRTELYAFHVSVAIAVTLAFVLFLKNPREDTVAALFPPWWKASEIVNAAASAGQPVRFGTLRWIIVVTGDKSVLNQRLRAAGAILLLNADSVFGCGS